MTSFKDLNTLIVPSPAQEYHMGNDIPDLRQQLAKDTDITITNNFHTDEEAIVVFEADTTQYTEPTEDLPDDPQDALLQDEATGDDWQAEEVDTEASENDSAPADSFTQNLQDSLAQLPKDESLSPPTPAPTSTATKEDLTLLEMLALECLGKTLLVPFALLPPNGLSFTEQPRLFLSHHTSDTSKQSYFSEMNEANNFCLIVAQHLVSKEDLLQLTGFTHSKAWHKPSQRSLADMLLEQGKNAIKNLASNEFEYSKDSDCFYCKLPLFLAQNEEGKLYNACVKINEITINQKPYFSVQVRHG